jgi:conjugative transfer signal peptidase TraF
MIYRIFFIASLGLALLAFTLTAPRARIVYNASSSAPLGWYLITANKTVRSGDLVLADLPAAVAAFADERHYLPRTVPILKHVGAMAGQRVCIKNRTVIIDGNVVGIALTHDGAHRALPVWNHCRVLAGDELFLFSAKPEGAFDARYFGPIRRSAVRGIAHPLWTWSES